MNLRIALLLFLFAPILLSGGDLKGVIAAKREIDAARAGSLVETEVDTFAADLQKYRNLAESEIEKIEEKQKEDLAELNRRYTEGLENVKVALPFADLLFFRLNPESAPSHTSVEACSSAFLSVAEPEQPADLMRGILGSGGLPEEQFPRLLPFRRSLPELRERFGICRVCSSETGSNPTRIVLFSGYR
jgi:hypothetical protein